MRLFKGLFLILIFCFSLSAGRTATVGEIRRFRNDAIPTDLYFSKLVGAPHLSIDSTVVDSFYIVMESGHGLVATDFITIHSGVGRFYYGTVVSESGDTLTMDVPLDFCFDSGSTVFELTRDMNVDGSVTPQVFQIGPVGDDIVLNITRVMFTMETTAIPALDEFGDQPALTRGVSLRITNGFVYNMFTIKTNFDLVNVAYDYVPYAATNPVQGVNGLGCRLTYAGEDKHDTFITIKEGETLEAWVLDDLQLIEKFWMLIGGNWTPVED